MIDSENNKQNGIVFKAITKRYGTDKSLAMAVKGVDFVIPKGSLTTILGPSGCGKTTILRMIAGLEMPTSGQIFINGKEVTTLGPADRNVSLVFQSYALFPHMSVIENVAYGLKMSNVPKAQALQKAKETLQLVGLIGFDERLPSELSGGQQQRVALARALVLEPAVLLFDEPLSNLDARLRREMREEIRSLQQRLNLTVAYVTHDQSEALAVSDQIIVMNHGVIAQIGTPEQLYEFPQSEFVAGFMGEAMLFPAQVLDSLEITLGSLVFKQNRTNKAGSVKLAIRPESWQIGLSPDSAQALKAVLLKRAYLGSYYEYTFETELGNIFVIAPDLQTPIEINQPVYLSLRDNKFSVVELG
jgi:iron(III) transport system ATP-binding protein